MSQSTTLLSVVVALGAATVPAQATAQEFWTRVGVLEDDVKNALLSGIAHGPYFAPEMRGMRALPAGARIAVIASAAAYAKRWTQTPDFRKRYAEYREMLKPETPPALMTTAQRKAADKADLQRVIRGLDSALAQAAGMPEVQAQFRALIQEQKDLIKAIDDPANPNYSKEAEAGMAELHAEERAAYEKAHKEWETKYPANPASLIRQQLRVFLALSATVDFSARLRTLEGGGKVFVNADYEEKPSDWKALFRAGQETTTALRNAAQQWLTELK